MADVDDVVEKKPETTKSTTTKTISETLNLYGDSGKKSTQQTQSDELAISEEENIRLSNHLLREVRVEAQEIIRILDECTAGNLDIRSHLSEFESSKKDIDERINKFQNMSSTAKELDDSNSEIFNLWQLAKGSPYFVAKKDSDMFVKPDQEKDRLRELNLLKERLARIIFLIEYHTGIERINSFIRDARPGYALPFHSIFEDEMKSPEDRQKILNLYSLRPKKIRNGIIDPVKGVILCYPEKTYEIALRCLALVAVFVLSFLFVNMMQPWLQDMIKTMPGVSENFQVSNNIRSCWTAMLIGLWGHVLVTGAKVSNVEFRQFPMPYGDWFYYFSARTTMIAYKIALSLFVFLSMYVLLMGRIGLMEAFLIGYSFDSVVELVGVSLEKRSSANVTAIKGRLDMASK